MVSRIRRVSVTDIRAARWRKKGAFLVVAKAKGLAETNVWSVVDCRVCSDTLFVCPSPFLLVVWTDRRQQPLAFPSITQEEREKSLVRKDFFSPRVCSAALKRTDGQWRYQRESWALYLE